MEFACRYIYVDESRSESDHQNPVIVSETQNGVVQSVQPYYDNGRSEEGLETEAKVDEPPQASQDDRLSSESNSHVKVKPPPVPNRKKKPSLACPSDSKTQQDLQPPCSMNKDKPKLPPPIPDRKKKPPVVHQPEAPEGDSVIYDYATAEEGRNPEAYGATPDQVIYDNAYEDVPPPDLEPAGLPQETRHLESKDAQYLNPPCCTNVDKKKTPPPIPKRTKKPPPFQQSGAMQSNTIAHDYAYAYEEVPPSQLEPGDGHFYMNAEPTQSVQSVPHDQNMPLVFQAPDVPKGHPGATISPNDNYYLEILPSLPKESETQRTPQPTPNRPLTPTIHNLHLLRPSTGSSNSGSFNSFPSYVNMSGNRIGRSSPSSLHFYIGQDIGVRSPDIAAAPPVINLPANCNILLLNIGKMVDYSGHSPPVYSEEDIPCFSEPQTLGPPSLCSRCSAAFSELNHVEEKKWTCVFCATENPITEGDRVESGGGGGGGDHLYSHDSQSGNKSIEDTMIIFCIDISGSMSVTTEVTEDQRYECHNNPTVYKSRMEAMQSGLSQTLYVLHEQQPWKRVALVTFSDQVKIYGDGTTQPQVLEDSELLDPDYLKSQGENQPVPLPLQQTLHLLETKIECLEESGVTALGPAALVSIAMAAKRPGSKVILCTDGRANTDLGNLENIAEEYAYRSSTLYYSTLADLALQHSVVVSVVTIEGTDCRLPELGMLADKTGGKVNIVHPFELASEFQSILEEEINATDVKLKLFLPHSMHFLYEGHTEPVLERTFGSTTPDTVLSTEFNIHSNKIKEVLRSSQLPIQVQLAFTLPDGRSRCRIMSQKRPVTNDGTAALESINLGVLQNHSVHLSARLAMEGRVTEATTVALDLKQLVDQVMRHEKYEDQGVVYEEWDNTMAPVYEDLQLYRQDKPSKKNDENDQTNIPVVKTFSDEMAQMIFQMKRAKNKVLSKLKHQAE